VSRLAILGGSPVVAGPLKPFRTIGAEERARVNEVIDGGLLSGFYGSWSEEFFGGPMVRRLEAAWREAFAAKHAVSVNSATSGLVAAMGAIGIGPGD
jgi:dTDP-4-amino-4,6-dideoxygalactose transaminase